MISLLAQSRGVGLLDIVLAIVYMGAVGYLGWLGYRHTKTAADYLLAGRKTHPFVMSLSYGATFISTSAIVGFGGVAAMFGMSLLWLTFLNIFVGVFIAFIFLGGPTRRMGHALEAHTFPELLGRRYNSKGVQILAGLIIILFMPIYAAAVLIGGCEFVAAAFGLPYTTALLVFASITAAYVFFGGLKGVLYTDAFQAVIMTVGMLVLLIWSYTLVGGVARGHEDLTAMKDQAFIGFKAIGQQGWTAMPKFGWGWGNVDPASGRPSPYNLWWIVVSTIVMGVGIGVLAQPQLVVRFLVVKSKRELNRALAVGGVFILLMVGVAYTVGSLSNVYFFRHEKITGREIATRDVDVVTKQEPGIRKTARCRIMEISTANDDTPDTFIILQGLGKDETTMPHAEVTRGPDAQVVVFPRATSFTRALTRQGGEWILNSDAIIPIYVTVAYPRWFRILFLLTLLAAAMSTMSSQYHTLGTAMGRDVFEQLFPLASPNSRRTIHIVRIGIIVGLALALIIGYYTRGGYFIARATAIFFGLCTSAFLPAFVGGLYFKRITRSAALASMVVGLLVTAFWLLFVKEAEAGSIGLVRLLTGQNSIFAGYPNWPVVDPLLIALPLSTITAIVVSAFTRPPAPAHLAKCFADRAADAASSAVVSR